MRLGGKQRWLGLHHAFISLLRQRVSMQACIQFQKHVGPREQAGPVQDGELVLQALSGTSAAQHAGVSKAAACLERRPACWAACACLAGTR